MGKYLLAFLLTTSFLTSQNIDGTLVDMVRYSQSNFTANARSAGLGISYNGILNDNANIINNPAGLTLTNLSELGVGLNFQNSSNSHSFLSYNNTSETNNTFLNNVSIAGPVFENLEDSQNLYFGLSYNSFAVTDRLISYDVFNPDLSYTGFEINNDRQWTRNLAFENESFLLVSDDLNQNYSLIENGRKHNLSIALASEFEEDFSIGGGINIAYGFFEYDRVFLESDVQNIYESDEPNINDGFDEVRHTLSYSHDYISASFNIGMIYNLDSNYRFTFNFTTPESMIVDELFIERATLTQDDGRRYSYDNLGFSSSSVFKVSLPWKIDLGASYNISDLTIAGAVRLKDYNSIDFYEAEDDYFFELNDEIPSQLKTSFEYGVGFEYNIPYTIFEIRGGYTAITSPIEGNDEITQLISAGLSIYLLKGLRVDMFYQNQRFDERLYLYGNTALQNNIDTKTFGLGLTYRY
jgi:opacity protein-like surface antigen